MRLVYAFVFALVLISMQSLTKAYVAYGPVYCKL